MSSHSPKGLLGELEQLVMLALIRLENQAHAPAITEEILKRTRIEFTRGTVFVALDRLEQKGYLRSYFSDPTPERGGKAKRMFEVTKIGRQALREYDRTIDRLRVRVPQHSKG